MIFFFITASGTPIMLASTLFVEDTESIIIRDGALDIVNCTFVENNVGYPSNFSDVLDPRESRYTRIPFNGAVFGFVQSDSGNRHFQMRFINSTFSRNFGGVIRGGYAYISGCNFTNNTGYVC